MRSIAEAGGNGSDGHVDIERRMRGLRRGAEEANPGATESAARTRRMVGFERRDHRFLRIESRTGPRSRPRRRMALAALRAFRRHASVKCIQHRAHFGNIEPCSGHGMRLDAIERGGYRVALGQHSVAEIRRLKAFVRECSTESGCGRPCLSGSGRAARHEPRTRGWARASRTRSSRRSRVGSRTSS